MRRTNIYLAADQLQRLRLLAEQRGQPVEALVREAIDTWLESQGVRVVLEDERERRFDALVRRRRRAVSRLAADEDGVRVT